MIDNQTNKKRKNAKFLTTHVSSFFLSFSLENLVKTFNGNGMTIEPKSRAKQWFLFYHRHWKRVEWCFSFCSKILHLCSEKHFTFICNRIESSRKIGIESLGLLCISYKQWRVSFYFVTRGKMPVNNTVFRTNVAYPIYIYNFICVTAIDLVFKIQLEPIYN